MLNNVLCDGVLYLVIGGLYMASVITLLNVIKDEVMKVLNRRKKKTEEVKETLEEKVARKQREFEAFKKYIESCPQPEDIEVAENLDITFDWSNLSLISRLTIDDVVINVNDKLLQHGCRVDYRNIAYHTLRNPLPTFN